MKQFIFVGIILMGVILVIPSLLVVWFADDEPEQAAQEATASIDSLQQQEQTQSAQSAGGELTVSVFRSQSETIEEVDFESYIAGVVASEMPASYEKEALKAQALTARTYIIRQMTSPSDVNIPEGADVTDTVMHQVFQDQEELKARHGDNYEDMMAKIEEAVAETKGEVITFNGSPITATFFSTSNGYTENSEEYWENEIPYLRSVESPWDKESPRFNGERTFTVPEFESTLGVSVAGISGSAIGDITERTTGGRVGKVRFGDTEFTGREIRDKLELDSSDFTITRNGTEIVVTTRGWGHGVGMSQFGADGMAKEGKTYQDIIHHYYKDVQITEADNILGSFTAKK
ncbi:stage II sporulation protein D [Bacillus sp. H-16]|uniref:stage II sporulation protein D n=1 Tax=Alteribacter salitolerans TaxID=2912333 RepID=UPI0019623149|nr:stage II sporulation protein D [Alteribacter salitolerans]MBM7095610.1 stage II sporulation protein D [Alteribacter salitolerans]